MTDDLIPILMLLKKFLEDRNYLICEYISLNTKFGNLSKGIAVYTCEIQINVLEPKVSRAEDPSTKLNLLVLPQEII